MAVSASEQKSGNEWLADVAEANLEEITDYWVQCLRTSDAPHYAIFSDDELKAELRPTVCSMINAFRTGRLEQVRGHTVGIITKRLQQGFSLPEVQIGLQYLEVSLRHVVDALYPAIEVRLQVAEAANTLYCQVALIVADVYQQLQAEQQARFLNVYRLGTSLSKTLNMDEVLNIAVSEVSRVSDASLVAIGTFGDDRLVEVRTSRPVSPSIDGKFLDICRAVGHNHHKAPLLEPRDSVHMVESVAREERLGELRDALIAQNCLSFICLPLVAVQQRLGSMMVFMKKEHSFAEFEIDFLLALAGHIGTAVQNASLYEEARGKRELGLLLEAGKIFTSTLDMQEVLDRVTRLTVEDIDADYAGVALPDSSNTLHITSYYARVGRPASVTKRLLSVFEPKGLKIGEGVTGKVFSSGEPILIDDYSRYSEAVSGITDIVGSVLAVPIKLRDKVIGVFTLASARPNVFSPDDVSIAKGVVSQAAIAIENAGLYSREKHIAETLQRSFLPIDLPEIPGYEIGAWYRAALAEAELGGDFYDVFRTDDCRLALLIADVSGKGLQAATHTAMGKYTIRAYSLMDPSPCYVLGNLNTAYLNYSIYGMFITAFYSLLNPQTHTLIYGSAGHNPPVFYRHDLDYLSKLDVTGPGIGIVGSAVYGAREIEMKRGDTLLLYTDGATDVRHKHRMLGLKGLERLFRGSVDMPADKIVEFIYQGILDYGNERLADDVALMVLKRTE